MIKLIVLVIALNVSLITADSIPSPNLKIWLDEYIFRPGELNLIRHVINTSDGTLSLAGRTKSRVIEPKGHKTLIRHDLLWTGRAACYAAFRERTISPTNTISCTPGTEAITGKSEFIKTMNTMYGPSIASTIMPTAFVLPDQYLKFASFIRTNAGINTTWALKEEVHRGAGVVAVSGLEALARGLETQSNPDPTDKNKLKQRFVLVQKFIDDQMLISNRPIVMRLWAVLSGGNPIFRSYLYNGGLALFGGEIMTDSPQGLVVNIFQQNRSAALDPWSVESFRAHLKVKTGSEEAFEKIWDRIQRSTAAALAAAVPSIRKETSKFRLPRYQGGNVEVLGLDYVIDSNMQPWLVEVNYLPSMARKIIDCVVAAGAQNQEKTAEKEENCIENEMDFEKEAFLRAHLKVLAARQKVLVHHSEAASLINTFPCKNISAEIIKQLLTAQVERQAALDAGFTDLTPVLYESLDCISGSTCSLFIEQPAEIKKNILVLKWKEKLILELSWLAAYFRNIIHHIDYVLQVAWDTRHLKRSPTSKLTYRPLNADALMRAWLEIPVKERHNLDAEGVFNTLCTYQQLAENDKSGEEEESSSTSRDEL